MAKQDNDISKDDEREQAFDAAIVMMIDRKTEGDHLICISEEGFRVLHLWYSAYPAAKGPHIKFMFKRSLEMKPYYPKIRQWFESQEMVWKDITIEGDRYMASLLPIERFRIIEHIHSAQQNIFGFSGLRVTAGNSDLNLALMNIRRPLLLFLSFAICFVSIGAYITYEFTRLFNIGPPSFQAVKKIEIMLFILFSAPLLSLMHWRTKQQKTPGAAKERSYSQIKVWRNRLILILIMSVMFFTY